MISNAGAVAEIFEGVAGGFDAVFGGDLAGGGLSLLFVIGLGEQGVDLAGDAEGGIAGAEDGAGDAEPFHAAGVVRLVVGVRHDEHGTAGAKALGGGADSALVNDELDAGEKGGVRGVLSHADGVREGLGRAVAGIVADEEDGAHVHAHGGAGGGLVEIAGGEDGSGAEGEDDRGLAGVEECFEGGRECGVAADGIVKTEAGDEGVGRPVFLFDAENA